MCGAQLCSLCAVVVHESCVRVCVFGLFLMFIILSVDERVGTSEFAIL